MSTVGWMVCVTWSPELPGGAGLVMNMDGGRSIPRDAWSLKHGELPFVSHQVPHKSPLSRDATDCHVIGPTVLGRAASRCKRRYAQTFPTSTRPVIASRPGIAFWTATPTCR